MSTIHVFGGARGMGRWFVDKVFLPQGLSVSVCDIDINTNSQLDKRVIANQVELTDGEYKNLPDIKSDDVVMLAVPINTFPVVCKSLFPKLPDGCLVFDIASVKVSALSSMHNFGDERLSILGTHPLFGPLVASSVGQVIVLCNYNDKENNHAHINRILQHSGLITVYATAEDHDEAMLYVQVLTHFAYMTFAKALSHSGKSLSSLLQFRTPPFTFLSAFAGRVVGSPAQTYANIQKVPEAKRIRQELIQAAEQLDNALDASKSLEDSISAIQAIVSPWKSSEVEECRSISKTAINAIESFESRLNNVRKKNSLCALKHLNKETIHIGVIKINKIDHITFEERSVRVYDKLSQSYKVAIGISDTARMNYARKGIVLSKPKKFDILKRNFQILSEAEFQQWEQENVLHINDDITVIAPLSFAPEFIESWFPKMISGLHSATFVSAYADKLHPLKIVLNVSYNPEFTIEEILSEIEALLRSTAANFA